MPPRTDQVCMQGAAASFCLIEHSATRFGVIPVTLSPSSLFLVAPGPPLPPTSLYRQVADERDAKKLLRQAAEHYGVPTTVAGAVYSVKHW